MKYAINFLKNYISNILFLFFIAAFSFFTYQNKSDLNNLFEFNLFNLSLLVVLYALSYLAKAKMNQHLYSTKDISRKKSSALLCIFFIAYVVRQQFLKLIDLVDTSPWHIILQQSVTANSSLFLFTFTVSFVQWWNPQNAQRKPRLSDSTGTQSPIHSFEMESICKAH